jgi:hypothetical protein
VGWEGGETVRPSTVTRSVAGSTETPGVSTRVPLMETRPAAMSRSVERRLPKPQDARNLLSLISPLCRKQMRRFGKDFDAF